MQYCVVILPFGFSSKNVPRDEDQKLRNTETLVSHLIVWFNEHRSEVSAVRLTPRNEARREPQSA